MLKKFLLALAALPVIAGAPAVNAREFARDGYRFQYTTQAQADGSTVITGRHLTDDKPFRFVVKGRRVTGDVDGQPVSFRIAAPMAAEKVIAAR